MASIALPRVPAPGRELEEYVAGLFQAAGYFVEKNIRRRDVAEVLELDAVATSYEGMLPASVLAEAKGGRWGFPDLFKVAGWMRYLGIERGGFFVKEPTSTASRDVQRMHETVAPLGVSLVDLGDFSDAAARFGQSGFRGLVDPLLLEVWRYSYWVERTLLDKVRHERRTHPAREGPADVLTYHDIINDHVFFIHDAADRLRRLYGGYRAHPKLSAAVAGELAGEPYRDVARGRVPLRDGRTYTEAMYQGKHPSVQAAFYVEHRARLGILKAAIDLACAATSGRLAERAAARRMLDTLPASFRAGLQTLQQRRSFRRYALLWQVFLWGFGGFTLSHREDEEFAWLSRQTGIPQDEIGEGLQAFDHLFPLGKGSSWVAPVHGTPIRLVKMMPVAFRGVGCVQRLRQLGARRYDGFGAGSIGRRTLISWHNGLVQLLAGASDAKEEPSKKQKAA